MKHTTIAIGITLLVTAFTSPPCSGADHEPTRVASGVHWINPDGLKGAAVMSAVSDGTRAWINPDGTQGLMERYLAPAPAPEYAWVNPDGHRDLSMAAINGAQHSDFLRTTPQPEVARYNDQLLYHVTNRDGATHMLTFVLAMLVTGSTLMLARNLWPH
jgi:hypothetical protein